MRITSLFVNVLLAAIVGAAVGKVTEYPLGYLFALLAPTPLLDWVFNELGASSTVILAVLVVNFLICPLLAALGAWVSAYGLGRLHRWFSYRWRIAAVIGAVLSVCISLAWAYYDLFVA